VNDTIAEPTETFFVNLVNLQTNGQNIVIGKGQGICTIIDDDEAKLSVNDVTVNENDGVAVITVSLNKVVQNVFTVDYSTADNTAIHTADYLQKLGTLTFGGSNPRLQDISITIVDDDIPEPTETFFFNLLNLQTNGQGVALDKHQGVVTILDDDAATLSINDVMVNESDGEAIFTVTLNKSVQNEFTVDFITQDNTAIAPEDYLHKNGTRTFGGDNPLTQHISISIVDDEILEPTETFFVNLDNLQHNGQDITIEKAQGIGTILDDDDDIATLSINDVMVNESDGEAIFTVTLSKALQNEFTVDFITQDNTATAPEDYLQKGGTRTFGGDNPFTQHISITIVDDEIPEPTETFFVSLINLQTNGQEITIVKAQGVGTIIDDDGEEPPPILLGDANCDGIVNVLDVVTIIGYILENNPSPFCIDEADMNEDGIVNVLDAVAVINYILAGGAKSVVHSTPADIFLSNEMIRLDSDGTLAALQFELIVENAESVKFQLMVDGFEMVSNIVGNRIIGVVFHAQNEPLPAGLIDLIGISGANNFSWGKVIAANTNKPYPDMVRIGIHNSPSDAFAVEVHPNPGNGDFVISIQLPVDAKLELSLFDIAGRIVGQLEPQWYNKGYHSIKWNVSERLGPGMFILRLTAATERKYYFSDKKVMTTR
jgi:hypothetical protein